MLPIEEQSSSAEVGHEVGGLLTGDLGTIVVRALVEQGVGYVVSSWQDRPTPIDAAIDDARARVLAPAGVVLRRLRTLSAIEPVVTAPIGGVTQAPPRGAVVFAGRSGLRPAVEQFLALQTAGAVVAFCFDADVLRVEDAIVVDPEPTAIGLARAIEQAFEASVLARRPAVVVLRERALGMRGTMRLGARRSPAQAAEADARRRDAEVGACPVNVAVERAGLVTVQRGVDGVGDANGRTQALVVDGPLRQAAERALAMVDAHLAQAGVVALTDSVALVSRRAVGTSPAPGSAAAVVLSAAQDVCVVGQRAPRVAARLAHEFGLERERVRDCTVDPGSARGEQLVQGIAAWLLSLHVEEDAEGSEERAAVTALRRIAELPSDGCSAVGSRLPRRGEVLHRSVPPVVAAGLALAQGVIGVPSRLDAAYPTYRSDTGVPVTVVPAAVFAQHGVAAAAPGTGHGVFVVLGPSAGVTEAAAAAGATSEAVDGGSPHAIGAAIGRAARSPRAASHVICVVEVQRVSGDVGGAFGVDPDLVGTERLASSPVPASATALVDLGDELLAGPSVLVLDRPEARAVAAPLRELTAATWDLRADRHASPGAVRRLGWNMRRRLVRSTGGIDL